MAKKIFNNDIARSMALAADVKEEEAELFIQHTSELIEEILQAEPLQDVARVLAGRSDREREAGGAQRLEGPGGGKQLGAIHFRSSFCCRRKISRLSSLTSACALPASSR